MKFSKNLALLFVLVLWSGTVFGATVTGIVTDATTGDVLPGANVVINTANPTGDATDLRGIFIIAGIPPGDYKLTITYIGYQKKIVDITLKPGEVAEISIELEHTVIKGEEVVVTAQAAGQTAAINQQISARNIKNIISEDRIQEIPEENIAGAVRRLPGVSLRGDKTVIRGLSPHYNQIQIDGVDMASTSFDERSSGLGMISQYMVGGIELTKSAMADQEADVIGGTVNLIMKEAPEKPFLRMMLQNGYNTLSESYTNPKFVLTGSKRYYNNLIGVLGMVSLEKGHSADNKMGASYEEVIIDAEKAMVPGNMNLQDSDNFLKNRIGASLVMDYTARKTKLKFSSFISTADNKSDVYGANYNDRDISNSISSGQTEQIVMNNALKLEQYVGSYKLNAGVSYAYSSNENPEELSAEIRFPHELEELAYWNMPPIEIPSLRVNEQIDIKRGTLMGLSNELQSSKSSQVSTNFDVQKNFGITDWIRIDFKMGGKYKHFSKQSDKDFYKVTFGPAESDIIESLFESDIEWMPDNYTDFRPSVNYYAGLFGGHLVVDENYREDDFLLGDYYLDNMPDIDKIRELHDFLSAKNWYWKEMG
ncbi:MAG: carboxypeptidase-like regulatory domain-containing protein, partial [bacterium]